MYISLSHKRGIDGRTAIDVNEQHDVDVASARDAAADAAAKSSADIIQYCEGTVPASTCNHLFTAGSPKIDLDQVQWSTTGSVHKK